MLPDLGAAGFTTRLGELLEAHAAGKPEAFDDIVRHAQDRLRRFASAMLRTSQVAREWHDTDDLLQGALIRLERALRDCQPTEATAFRKLATVQLKRELRDLIKALRRRKRDVGRVSRLDNPVDVGGTSPRAMDPADPATNHEHLLDWTELHDSIERLPDDQREVMDLIFYNGQTHEQAAALLGVASKTVQRRLRQAKEQLAGAIKHFPGAGG
jgi:RNA polymerase sigma factor (sigma-70 family)